MSADRRLDEVVAMVGRAQPRLDEITRARVAARVDAGLGRSEVAPAATASRRWPITAMVAGGALAAAAAVVVVLLSRDRGERGLAIVIADQPPGPDSLALPAIPSLSPTAPPAAPVRIDVVAGDSRRLELGDSVVTVFGPGHLDGGREHAIAEAAALMVDRPRGEEPWSLRYHGVEVIATRATFALDHGPAVRVTVMRGEVLLLCRDAPRRVQAGDSAACEIEAASPAPPRRRVAEAAPPPLPRPGPEPEPEPGPVPEPGPEPEPVPVPVPVPGSEPEPGPGPATEPVASSMAPDLYALAEGAMRRGDPVGARAALQAVIAAAPASLDAALALLDLALLAHRDRDDRAARAYLDRLGRHPHRGAVAAPAARLRAQLAPR